MHLRAPQPTRSPRAKLALLAGTLCCLLLGSVGPAQATSLGAWPDLPRFEDILSRFPELPGIALGDLVDGAGSFTSDNGELTFGNFDATVTGPVPHNLDFYRVIPLDDGFRLLTPLFGLMGSDAKLNLSYGVEAAEDLLIESVSLSFLGGALHAKTQTAMLVKDLDDQKLGYLHVWDQSRFGSVWHRCLADRPHEHGQPDDGYGQEEPGFDHKRGKRGRRARYHDHDDLLRAVDELMVSEKITVDTGFLAATWVVDHHFHTRVVPEPTTALLLGLGLTGLAVADRRRRPRA